MSSEDDARETAYKLQMEAAAAFEEAERKDAEPVITPLAIGMFRIKLSQAEWEEEEKAFLHAIDNLPNLPEQEKAAQKVVMAEVVCELLATPNLPDYEAAVYRNWLRKIEEA